MLIRSFINFSHRVITSFPLRWLLSSSAFDDTSFILSAHTAGQLLPVRAYLDDAEVAFAGNKGAEICFVYHVFPS